MGKSLNNLGFGCTERSLSNSGPGGQGGSTSQPATIYDTKSPGTDAGTFTSGSWQIRDINTVQSDPAGIAIISSNQILLKEGSYVFLISCPAYSVGTHQARLYNSTSAVVIAEGTVEVTTGMSVQTRSVIKCSTTLVVPSTLEIQHYCTVTKLDNGLGFAGNISNEIYTVLQIWAAT